MTAMQSENLVRRPARRHQRYRGLTLMELVVVMSILAALAAIILPLFPNLLRRSHKVTDATQTSETAKAVQLYQSLYLSYPDGFDTLTDGGTTGFPDFLPADGGSVFGGYIGANPGTLTADEVAALHRVGIDNVNTLVATAPNHPTLDPYGSTVALDTTLGVAILDTTVALNNQTLKNAIEADPTARFVVFGVGPRCSMVGKTIQDAPTSVPQNKEFTPATLYSRVGVIFKISGAEVDKTERARFIAAVAMEDDELESTEKDVIGYYDVAAGEEAN